MFRWHAIAGEFAANVGGTMPRNSSPCGTVLDLEAVLLFQHPERHFSYPVPVDPPMVEAQRIPFQVDGRTAGTVWAIANSTDRQFDGEDARLLSSLSRFASTAVQTIERASSKRYTDTLLEAQKQVLELIVQGQPLADLLAALCRVAEDGGPPPKPGSTLRATRRYRQTRRAGTGRRWQWRINPWSPGGVAWRIPAPTEPVPNTTLFDGRRPMGYPLPPVRQTRYRSSTPPGAGTAPASPVSVAPGDPQVGDDLGRATL